MSRKLRDTFDLDLAEAARSGRLIEGVSVQGTTSRNGRHYLRSALEDTRDHIRDGRANVYADHPPRGGGDPVRGVETLVGRLLRPRLAGDRVKADLKVVDAEPWRSLLPSIAEDMPEAAGLSIRARGRVRTGEDGVQVVEAVTDLLAVELVTEPATVGALVESVQQGRREAIVEILEEGDVDPDGLGLFVRWAARQPDGVEQARAFVEEFHEAVDPRPRRGGASGAVAHERDPDVILEEAARRDRGRRPVTSDVLEEAADRLFN